MYNFGLLSADITLLYADRRHRIVITSAFDMTAVRSCMPVFCCFTLLSRLYLFTRLCIFAKMTHFRQHFVQLYHRDKLAYWIDVKLIKLLLLPHISYVAVSTNHYHSSCRISYYRLNVDITAEYVRLTLTVTMFINIIVIFIESLFLQIYPFQDLLWSWTDTALSATSMHFYLTLYVFSATAAVQEAIQLKKLNVMRWSRQWTECIIC